MELHYPALGLTAVLTAALTLWRPVWALGVLLAALPFFTRHPSTAAATGFIAIVAVFQCAWMLRRRPAPGAAFDAIRHTPLLAAVAAFALAAVASLAALPLTGLWAEQSTAFALAGPRGWPGLVEQFAESMRAMGPARKGDSIDIDLVDGQIQVLLNGQPRGGPIVGEALFNAILQVFIGPRPVDRDLKRGLLGG